jgi:hypothetical protein
MSEHTLTNETMKDAAIGALGWILAVAPDSLLTTITAGLVTATAAIRFGMAIHDALKRKKAKEIDG